LTDLLRWVTELRPQTGDADRGPEPFERPGRARIMTTEEKSTARISVESTILVAESQRGYWAVG
jgi:hypothetical protein